MAGKKNKVELIEKLDKRITNREFKLLLQPDGLDRHSRVGQLQRAIHELCDDAGIVFSSPETMVGGLRNVFFVDTDDRAFHRNKLILRVRESRSNIWLDDWCEVTFKCRSENIDRAWAYNPVPHSDLAHRIRFKEEILKDGAIGSIRRIYSHNSVLDTVPAELLTKQKLRQLAAVYPGLAQVNLPLDKTAQMVGGRRNKVLEACVTLGHIAFSESVLAHCEIAIWFRAIGKPMVGELAFAYRVSKTNRRDIAAHQCADDFFRKLQAHFAAQLAIGTTKTAMVYGSHE
ncbi:MAG: hypothetical protein H6R17_213 [Proteobacteria bacterium]|nr:hypothetical protein [Pseudomonadota bacterium]